MTSEILHINPNSDAAAPQRPNPAEVEHPPSKLLNWIAHFTVYLGVVALLCAIGVYFMWRLPVPQDLEQLFKSDGHGTAGSRSASTGDSNPPAAANELQPSANAPNDAATEAATPPATPNPSADDEVTVVADTPASAPETPPAPATPPVPPTPHTEITQLLTDAEQQMESRRITAPASANALSSYRRVLELDPNNAAAQAGIARIAEYYRDIAEKSLLQGRPDESVAYVNRGLRAAPQDQNLVNLRSKAQLLQQQREEEQRRAQREEQRQRELEREQEQIEQAYQEELRQRRLQMQQQTQRPQPAAQPWWQAPPTYDQGSGFNQR